MAKQPLKYRCSSCGTTTNKWAGCCLQCKEWHTLEEQSVAPVSSPGITSQASPTVVRSLSELPAQESNTRLLSTLDEWDRVMGGGLMPGAFIIITGDPGIGKSTLLLQVAAHLAQQHAVLYFSSEESLHQLKQRADRLECGATENLRFF